MEPLVPSVTLGEGWHEVFLPGPGGTSQDFDDIEDVMLKKYIGDREVLCHGDGCGGAHHDSERHYAIL